MDHRELLSVAETAQRLGRSTEQVRRYLREGRLPGQRLGGQWFIATDAIAAFQPRPSPSSSPALATATGFLTQLRRSADDDPLGATIGIGASAAGDIARGKAAYRAARRTHE